MAGTPGGFHGIWEAVGGAIAGIVAGALAVWRVLSRGGGQAAKLDAPPTCQGCPDLATLKHDVQALAQAHSENRPLMLKIIRLEEQVGDIEAQVTRDRDTGQRDREEIKATLRRLEDKMDRLMMGPRGNGASK